MKLLPRRSLDGILIFQSGLEFGAASAPGCRGFGRDWGRDFLLGESCVAGDALRIR